VALVFTQILTEISTRKFGGSRARSAHKVDTFTATCEPIDLENARSSNLTTLKASTAS
jgi:hypothetical protein